MKKKKNRQRITKIQLFINEYNWEGIHFPLEKDDLKKCEKNNLTLALEVLYAKKMYHAYFSKHNSNREKLVIVLMILNEQIRVAKSKGQQ